MSKKLLFILSGVLLISASCTKTVNDVSEISTKTENIVSAVHDQETVNFIEVSSDRTPGPSSVADIIERSEIVVQGYILGDQTEEYQKDPDGSIVYGVTVSPLVITKVFQGDVKIGDTLRFAEPYYSQKSNNQMDVYCSNKYRPIDIGREYIFFLYMAPEDSPLYGIYGMAFSEDCRYPVPSNTVKARSVDDLTSADFNLGPTSPKALERYKKLYEEVMEAYLTK